MKFALLWFSMLLTATFPAHAEIIGRASVIDGDTIEIHGQRIRLHGVDAPESSQTCKKGNQEYKCGQQAALALSDLIEVSPVTCEKKDIDRYKRVVAECFIKNTNINSWLVQHGWALAYRTYSKQYIRDEDRARAAQVGLWQGTFIEPWNYRKQARKSKSKETSATNAKCNIKGNISGKSKRIYHVPGTEWYANTVINTEKGEQWFCSEQDARNAGWIKAAP